MKKLVRLTSVLVVVSLLFILCAIPASAAEMSGTATIHLGYVYNGSYSLDSTGYSFNYSTLTEQSKRYSLLGKSYVGLGSVDLDDEGVYYTGAVGVYLSYFIGNYLTNIVGTPGLPTLQYKNHLGDIGTDSTGVEQTTFTPQGVSSGYSTGISLSCSFLGSEAHPISDLRILGNSNSIVGYHPDGGTQSFYLYLTSFRVIATETSADLEALESIADGIAAQNGILQAMYGDIIAICNSIYAKTGDMVTAQELTNSYFASIIPVLNDIKDLNTNIYSLLSAQFAALISAVQTESSNIQASISAQTAALIAYFDSIQNVSSVPDSIQDKTQQGETIRNDMAGLNKPDLTAPDPSDFFTDAEAAPFTDVLGQLFSSSLIVNLLLVAFSIAFVAYVLYGKE